jgi:ATP-binding cassette, subfamily B, bacterial PglK
MTDVLNKLNYLLSRREKRNGVILFLMMIVGAFFEVVGVGAIPAFVGIIAMPERILEIEAARSVYDYLGMESPQDMVFWSAIALIVIFVVKNVYIAWLAYMKARYTSNRQVNLSNRLFRAYLSTSYTFHLQRNTAELLRNTNSEAGAITTGALMPILVLIMEFMTLAMIFALLFAVEPVVTLAAFIVLGTVTVVFYRATKKKIRWYAKEEQRYRKQSVQAVNQGLGGVKDAKILGREGFFLASYQESTWFKAKAARFKAVIQALPRLFLETMAVFGMLGISAYLVADGRATETIIPTLTLLAVAIIRLMPSFQKIASSFSSLKFGERALEVVYEDLRELEEREKEYRRRMQEGLKKPLPFQQELHLDNVSYSYPESAEAALRDVTLTIPRGSAIGFVGPSGAGKSTIVDLILGLLTPDAGVVTVDGIDIQDRMPAWQRKIGYIPQSIYLTDDTIRRNIAFGRADKEIDDDAVWDAIEASQLRELVESLPEGLDTIVGERGVRLSGGQRQRIGIARALYHKPEVLVMDEATSALDNQTERHIVDALEAIRGRHTLIMIAHRLSTVQNCDTLFMLEHGKLVAQGTYDELLAASPEFAAMAGIVEPVPTG